MTQPKKMTRSINLFLHQIFHHRRPVLEPFRAERDDLAIELIGTAFVWSVIDKTGARAKAYAIQKDDLAATVD